MITAMTATRELTVKKYQGRYYVFEAGTDRYFYSKSYKRLDNAIKHAHELESLGYGTYIGTDEVQEKNATACATCQQFGVKVGDIWYSSWGYEQTNIDYYEVTKVTKCYVWLTPISKLVEETGYDQGYTMPCKGAFRGEAKRHRINSYGTVTLTSYSDAYPWDGKPKYSTWYY